MSVLGAGCSPPCSTRLLRRGTPLPLVLHPTRPGVAALDARVSPASVAAGDANPGWLGPLPTNSSVTGGWGVKLAAVVASLVLFGALSVLVTVATGASRRSAMSPLDRVGGFPFVP